MMSAAFPWPSCELCNHSFHSTQIKQAYSQATECRDVAQSSMNSLRSPMPDPDTSHTSNRLLDASVLRLVLSNVNLPYVGDRGA
jgi:hypothetical protein